MRFFSSNQKWCIFFHCFRRSLVSCKKRSSTVSVVLNAFPPNNIGSIPGFINKITGVPSWNLGTIKQPGRTTKVCISDRDFPDKMSPLFILVMSSLPTRLLRNPLHSSEEEYRNLIRGFSEWLKLSTCAYKTEPRLKWADWSYIIFLSDVKSC